MVEGSGFLQWLSVFALATDPDLDVLLLDEPDAHLHTSLQEQLLDSLRDVAATTGKQMLIATHSAEILRNAEPSDILHIRAAAKAAGTSSRRARRSGCSRASGRTTRRGSIARSAPSASSSSRGVRPPDPQDPRRASSGWRGRAVGGVDERLWPEGAQAGLHRAEGGDPGPRRREPARPRRRARRDGRRGPRGRRRWRGRIQPSPLAAPLHGELPHLAAGDRGRDGSQRGSGEASDLRDRHAISVGANFTDTDATGCASRRARQAGPQAAEAAPRSSGSSTPRPSTSLRTWTRRRSPTTSRRSSTSSCPSREGAVAGRRGPAAGLGSL